MRSDKYMEKIILDDLETFKRKGNLATEAVTEYVQSVESKVRQRSSYNIQNQFKELQSLLQESCQTLNRVIIGLANMVPSSDVNLSRPIEDAPRPMITSDILPPAQWSSSDCSTKIDHERNSSSPSPDIALDGKREAMVEPSSSSASSTSSTTDANFKARVRMMEILKKQRQRSKPEEDEFAMEIPEPTIKLNVDAPEFKPSALDSKSSFSQTSTSSDNETAVRTRNTLATLPQKQCDPIGDPQSGARQRIPDASGQDMEPKALKAKTSSSSMESFLTASAADYDQERDDEQTPTQEIKSVAGFEITSSNGFGAGDRKDIEGLAPNSYTGGVESRPSSISTRNVIYDTEQVLRGTAKALRDQAPNGFREEAGFRLPNRHANNDDTDQLPRETMDDSREKETPHVTQVLVDGLDRWAQQQMPVCAPQQMQTEDQQIAVELGAALKQWIPKQTQGETPPDVRCTRVPPLWNYVHVSFSDVDLKTGKVYVQMLADELVIAQLADEVNSRTWSMIPKRNIADLRGCWVIAPYHDAKYRAQVVSSESEDNIEVYFLDYGNKATVSLQDLRVMSGRKLLKTCKIAIPCVLDDALMRIPNILNDMPETAYVCLANPYESNGETVYVIMDVMPSTRENFQELPDPGMFYASQDLSVVPYTVVISHATSPESMWLVEQKDLETLKEIEGILERLPPELCTLELATKSVYVAYGGKRAMVLDRREDRYDLLLLDNGKTVKNVPLSACRRLPLLAHMQPRAAKYATLANCKVPANRPDLGEKMMAPHIGRTFDMKKKNDDTDEVILIDPETRKYLANELKAKYGL